MTPLLISEEVIHALKELVKYAEANPYSMDDLLDIHNKALRPPGEDDGFTVVIPFGYRVVLTIEHQPAGVVRHMSMSHHSAGMLPSVAGTNRVMELLGFEHTIEDGAGILEIGMEDIGPNHQAINISELITPKMS